MNASSDSIIIDAAGLAKQFGDEYAVRDVTFRIPRGQIFGFIGPSGSGKTTTVRMLTGFYTPTAGKVTVLGDTPHRFSRKVKSKIGYMPQLFALYPDLTVWENLNFSASLYGMGIFRRKRLKSILEFVELGQHRGKLTRKISGGMQRRLSLAATLVHRPDLIFLDEPTAGIDPVLRRKFWDYFRELHSEGRTLFVTTQYVSEASYCDAIGVMAKGKLLMVETPDGLRSRAYGGEMIDLHPAQPLYTDQLSHLTALPLIKEISSRLEDGGIRLVVEQARTAIPDVLDWCSQNRVEVKSVEPYEPPFDDVFVQILKNEDVKTEEA